MEFDIFTNDHEIIEIYHAFELVEFSETGLLRAAVGCLANGIVRTSSTQLGLIEGKRNGI